MESVFHLLRKSRKQERLISPLAGLGDACPATLRMVVPRQCPTLEAEKSNYDAVLTGDNGFDVHHARHSPVAYPRDKTVDQKYPNYS